MFSQGPFHLQCIAVDGDHDKTGVDSAPGMPAVRSTFHQQNATQQVRQLLEAQARQVPEAHPQYVGWLWGCGEAVTHMW